MEFPLHPPLNGNSNSKTMKTITTAAFLFLFGAGAFAQNTLGDIIGTLIDPQTKQGVFDATVVTKRGDAVYREKTDPDGRFRLSAIPAGTYRVMFILHGDTVVAPEEVEVAPDSYGDLGVVEFTKATEIGPIVVIDRMRIEKGEAPITKITAKEIAVSANKFSVAGMVTGANPEVRQTDDGLVFRGARAGDFIYYIDGVKMKEVFNPPSAAINYIMVYSGAIPAKYGDTNGGVVVIETKGYFDLLREYNSRMSLAGF